MMLLKEKRKLLCVRMFMNTHKNSTFSLFKAVLGEFGIAHMCKFRESQNLGIVFPNGSEILFVGCDDEQKTLSLHGCDCCFIEECSQLPSVEIVHQLFMRLRSNRGLENENCFFFSFNPTSELSWCKSQLVEDPEIIANGIIHHSTYKDNPFITDEYRKQIEAMKVSNPRKWKVFGLGQWGTMGELVYENWRIENFDETELLKSGKYQTLCGLDWGYNDPTAFLQGLADVENKRLYLCKELYKQHMLNEDIANWIKEHGFERCRIIADASEPKAIQTIKAKYGIRRIEGAKKGADSIRFGIDYASTWDIVVHPSLKNTIMEFESYAWKVDRKTGKTLSEPIDSFNHLMDCLRYMLEPLALQNKNRVRTLPKSALGL